MLSPQNTTAMNALQTEDADSALQNREGKVMFGKHFLVLAITEEVINCLWLALIFSGYIHLRQLT